MESRRSFLKTSGSAAALLGTMGFAGCSEVENALGGGGDKGTSYSNWLYDPSDLMDGEFRGFGTFNVQSIYENEEHIPDAVFEDLEESNDQLSEFGVDLEQTSDMTAMGYTGNFDIQNQPSMSEVSSGGSVAITGSFEVSDMEDAIELANQDVPPEQQLEEDDEYEGYTVYTTSYENQPPQGEPVTQSGTIAMSEDSVVMGGMQSNDAEAREAMELMVDAESGSADRWTDENEDGDELVSQLGSNTMAMGMTLDEEQVDQIMGMAGFLVGDDQEAQEALSLVQDVVENMVAIGMAIEINGEEYEARFAMVYDESDNADSGAVEDLFDFLKEQNESDMENPLENVEVSENGRTVMVTTTGDTEELFESATESAGAGSSSESGTEQGTEDDTDYAFDPTMAVSTANIIDAATPGGGVDLGY